MIDTHAHLQSRKFSRTEIPDILARAEDAGVTDIVCLATCLEDCGDVLRLAEEFPMIHACVGVHPTSVVETEDRFLGKPWMDALREFAAHPRVVAIGEIGLDYYHQPPEGWDWDRYKKRQFEFLRAQLDLAVELGKNAVIHQRATGSDAPDFLQGWQGKLCAVFHCFEGSSEEAAAIVGGGHLVSFTGSVTHPRLAGIESVLSALPAGSFMVETDSPYLAPKTKRGKRCEPSFVAETLQWIADARGESAGVVDESTTTTARTFFGLR